MSAWREVAIGALCSRITSGGTPRRKRADFFCEPPDGIPWIKSQELVDRRIESAKEHISLEGLRCSSAKLLPPQSVLIAMYGATVGQLGFLEIEAAVNQAVCVVVTDPTIADSRFLFYALMNARHGLIAHAHGAAQQNLSQDRIRNFHLQMPEIEVQQRVAVVLYCLDQLIDNNRQRIDLLEESARALYREWFVRRRLPSQLEDIGNTSTWMVCPLRHVTLLIKRGIAPKYDDYGPSVVLNQRCIRHGRVDLGPVRRQSKAIPPERQIQFGDVLVNSTGVGTLGRVAQVYRDLPSATVDSHVTILRPDSAQLDLDFFGQAMLDTEPELASLGVGSTGQTELGAEVIGALRKAIPPLQLQSEFGCRVSQVRHLAITLQEQVRTLAAARDLLVPKLVTGQLKVDSLGVDDVFGWVELAEELPADSMPARSGR